MTEKNDNVVLSDEQFGKDSSPAYEKIPLSPKKVKLPILSSLFQTSSDSEEKRYRLLGKQESSCCCRRPKK